MPWWDKSHKPVLIFHLTSFFLLNLRIFFSVLTMFDFLFN